MSTFNSYADISSIKKGTKVLFASFPGDGHFNPLTGLAVHLRNLGCDVRWYTSVYYQEKVQKMDMPFYGFKKALDIAGKEPDAVFPERKLHKSKFAKLKFDLIHVFILRSTEYYEDIQEIYEEFPFQVMFCDITFGAIPFVKEKMGIPVISAGIVPLAETSKDLPPYGMGITPSTGLLGRIKHAFLRKLSDRMIFSKPTRIMSEILRSHGIDSGNHNIFDVLIRKSTIVLQSGTPGFEYSRSDMGSNIHFAGPLLPHKKARTAPQWTHPKLKAYDKLILVTQGTVEKDVNKLLVPALEAFKDTEYLLVVTTGGSQTLELRKRYPQNNIIIEDFIAFDDIMPLADVYISNGGYGGVLLSIQNSLPMVVAGVHEGKNEINARVGYFKLGMNLGTELPSSAQLKKATLEVLSNPVYTDNVNRLRQEFRTYNPNEICARHLSALLAKTQVAKLRSRRDNLEAIY